MVMYIFAYLHLYHNSYCTIGNRVEFVNKMQYTMQHCAIR